MEIFLFVVEKIAFLLKNYILSWVLCNLLSIFLL